MISRVPVLQPLVVVLRHSCVRLEGELWAHTVAVNLILSLLASHGVLIKLREFLALMVLGVPILLAPVSPLLLLNHAITLIAVSIYGLHGGHASGGLGDIGLKSALAPLS